MFFLPLLLVCSISADQPETPLQPPCPQDIHAVLREMTASLTEQKVEIRSLKEHNKGKILPLGITEVPVSQHVAPRMVFLTQHPKYLHLLLGHRIFVFLR